ncbi:RES family NAD+ phosphorylase [Cupriavidus sp. AU9028]|uniref:RES family NAD+ phosphorylase n=1 Tax=Cupriavidus sp. AU9028 TaxID=2871157 RepID=UPI001C9471D4|nr:RES family NAD+ phosphorylase [Cupriavidus sp. AU9028]MBY4899046.1 RES family NAD+ phosphorylase [Cupriavidus sp. AU9028]
MSAPASEGVTLWRIGTDTPLYEAHDIGGKGAELTGGRWNRTGTPMVYAASSRALACLETLVHLGGSLPLNRYLVGFVVPTVAWTSAVQLDPANHVGWDALPAGKTSIDWGTAWAAGQSSLLAKVPSVIVPEEYNVLINPAHPDIGTVQATKIRKWHYDPRMGNRAP